MEKFIMLYKLVAEDDYSHQINECTAKLVPCGVCSYADFEVDKDKCCTQLSKNTQKCVYSLPGFVRRVKNGFVCNIYEPKSACCASNVFGTCDVSFAVVYEVMGCE